MELQQALASRNFYSGPVDGIWGPKTASALRNFQVQNELGATGQLDDATASALGMTMERQNVSGKEQGSQGASVGASGASGQQGAAQSATPGASARSSTQIRLDTLSQQQAQQLQQRLQSLGFYQGAIDGQLGAGTRAALQRYFQQQASLAQQGVLSDSTIGIFGAQPGELQPVSGQEGEADTGGTMSPHGPSMNRQQPKASPSGSSPTQGAPRMDGTQGNSGSRGSSSPGAQGSSSSGSQPSPGAQGSSSSGSQPSPGAQGSSGSGAQGGGTTP